MVTPLPNLTGAANGTQRGARQNKLIDFFSSKKKAERIEIDSSGSGSDSDYKEGKRSNTVARAAAIPMSQGDIPNGRRQAKSKSTKRQKSKRRRPFSLTKKRDDVLRIATNQTEEETRVTHDSFAWAFFAKKLNYTTNLVYDSPSCTSDMNDPLNLEPKLQKLDAENRRVLQQFREREG